MDSKQLIALVVSLGVPVILRVIDRYLKTHLANDPKVAEAVEVALKMETKS